MKIAVDVSEVKKHGFMISSEELYFIFNNAFQGFDVEVAPRYPEDWSF
jgi:hypothetical protein